jgi:hypothetical protein
MRRVRNERTGGKILSIHDRGGKALYGLFLSLILFSLTAPSLQSGVVEPYPLHATWFPSRLPLVETDRI